jgi:hypothetical protein
MAAHRTAAGSSHGYCGKALRLICPGMHHISDIRRISPGPRCGAGRRRMEEAAMAQHRAPSKHVGTWIVITFLLAAALIGTLWVPFYNYLTPVFGGFPFFYWYQLMWVPIVAILAAVAYLLSRWAQRGNGNAANDQVLDKDEQEANLR